MRIFIDTADLDEIREACSWGIVDGATTNPSLIKKAVDKRGGRITMDEYIREIVETVPGPVSLEVIALGTDGMVEQAKDLYKKFSPYGNIAIKIPVNPQMNGTTHDFDGLKAMKKLNEGEIPVNATLIMTPEQALLAAKAGATYASPFAGRVDDYIRTKLGMERGVNFQKEDYFDSTLIRRMLEHKLIHETRSVSETYLDENTRRLVSNTHDNGVTSGVDLIQRIVKTYKTYGYETQVIAASLRNARQVREVAEIGVDIATIPFNVLREMIRHSKTMEGVKSFSRDVVPAYEALFK